MKKSLIALLFVLILGSVLLSEKGQAASNPQEGRNAVPYNDPSVTAVVDLSDKILQRNSVNRSAIFNADFQDGTAQGFTLTPVIGSALWHVANNVCQAQLPGHTTPFTMYYGIDANCTYNAGRTASNITSPSIPISGTTTMLSFNYLLQVESLSIFDVAFVDISTDGGATFTQILSKSNLINNNTWQNLTVDISSVVGNATAINVRFRFDTVDSILNSTIGWHIDDVQILGDACSVEHTAIFAADTRNNRVQKSINDGISWSTVGFGAGVGPGQFNAPKGIATSSNSMIVFVADTGNNRIQRSTDGGLTWARIATSGIALGQVNAPQSVAYDEMANILYIADTNNNRIQMVTNASTLSPTFSIYADATSGATIGKFNKPSSVAVSCSGMVYVADTANNRIQVNINNLPTGWTIFAGATAGTALGKVNGPKAIFVDSMDRVYVADTLNNRIQMNTGGTTAGWSLFMGAGSTPGSVNAPEGVSVTSSQKVFVGDTGNNRVQAKAIAPGSPSSIVGTSGTLIGQFSGVSGMR